MAAERKEMPQMQFIKDIDCTRDTPVLHGAPDTPIYGAGISIRPCCPGKNATEYEKKTFLPELLPLEEYGQVIVLFSGGKDSTAAYYKLLELGVPKGKIELWHHDVDGGHPDRRMDWPVTQAYVRAFAQAEGIPLRLSWRTGGFWSEVYRLGASLPIKYEDSGEVRTCRLTPAQLESNRLRAQILAEECPEAHELLKQYGQRMKFPAKTGDLARRWCSATLKIDVASAVLRNLSALSQCGGRLTAEVQSGAMVNLEQANSGARILIVSGERRGESANRSKYNEMELHRCHATARAHRLVHAWRPVIDYSERDIWEVIKRHHATPHPCYSCGWNRCSCMMCIFSRPTLWAGIRELFPTEYEAFRQDEIRLGFTLDTKVDLDTFVGDAPSCVCHDNPRALHQLVSGEFAVGDVYTTGAWNYPAGAFRGAEGGPC